MSAGVAAFNEAQLAELMRQFLDADWYLARYPDIAAAELDPALHFIRYGAAEKRDPNGFFDSAWYIEHHPDVAASGLNPLLHYLHAGAAELRNPHPRFDATYYVQQHPAAAANPVLYHLKIGAARGYKTERIVDIRDYLPSLNPPLTSPRGVFADIVIRVHRGLEATQRCIRSVLANRVFPLGRVIVIDDRSPDPHLSSWLSQLASEGDIHLIRNPRVLGPTASAAIGIDAGEGHDIALLDTETIVPPGWLLRLSAHAYAQADVATVSPLFDQGSITGQAGSGTDMSIGIDRVCQAVNAGRSVDISTTPGHCLYIRRSALVAVGDFAGGDTDFCQRALAAGWRHRLACDTFVGRGRPRSGKDHGDRNACAMPAAALPFRFAATASVFRHLKLPVILMVSHGFGGGVRRHINSLVERYQDQARVLLLQGTDRGAELSVPSAASDPVLTLPSDRLDDLLTVLRSINVSRVHVHHLLQMDMDIRTLIQRLDVPFDVTVHDYHAICPQINLLRWSEGIYCGEPGPAACNACIASQSSHGARDIVSWRRERAWQFMDAERVICPSADVKVRLARHAFAERTIVVPHEQQTQTVWRTCLPKFRAPPLRIVLLGVLANHKGARSVAEVAETAIPGTIELHLIGHVERSFPPAASKLIKMTGEYHETDLPALLKKIDPHVFWFPSSAAETYSFTLSTAIATGRPIVATDLGSFSERLNGRPGTWLVDHRASAADWLAVFEDVRAKLRNRADTPAVSRQPVVSDFYTDHYLAPAPRRAAADRKLRIAILPERYDTGGLTPCAYIRLLQPLDHLAAQGALDIILADLKTIFSCDADVIVTQRCAAGTVETANRLARQAQRMGAKLLYDLDDDLLQVPDDHPDADRLQQFSTVVQRMLTVSDTVWVSTPGLARRLATIRPDAMVMENRLDERIWAQSQPPQPFWNDPIRILCMGTSTHENDFALIEPALLRLKAEYGHRIAIDVLGMTNRHELPAALNRIGPSTHASRSYPGFVDWLTSRQPRWHIGLAPLLDTPFNRSKSPIKAMDYAAMGLAVLASDVPVYRGSIADGPAGQLVANDHHAWHSTLDWLIRHQALLETHAIRAHQAFLATGTLASQIETRLAALNNLLPLRTMAPGAGLQGERLMPIISHGSVDQTAGSKRHPRRGRRSGAAASRAGVQ